MKKNILIISLIFIIIFRLHAQKAEPRVSILFVGDIMQHGPQIKAAYCSKTKQYNYDSCFRFVKPHFEKADLVIANLEVTLSGAPYSGYPQFSAPDALARDLKNAGVDVFVTANNHCCDRDLKGVTRTIKVLDSLEIPHTGTFISGKEKQQKEPLIIRKNGLQIALLNYTYDTNGRPIPKGTAVNLIDTLKMAADLEKTKALKPDEIIVFLHWGLEYKREPSVAQRKVEAFLRRKGVRIIIGSHPHVIQPMEAMKDPNNQYTSFTVFSMGNFVSNQRKQYTDGGTMAYVELSKDENGIKIENPSYVLTWVKLRKNSGLSTYTVLPVTDFENDTSSFLPDERTAFNLFCADARDLVGRLNINVPEKTEKKPSFDFYKDILKYLNITF